MRDVLGRAKARVREEVVARDLGYFQPGKEVSMSIFPLPGVSVSVLENAVRTALSGLGDAIAVRTSATCRLAISLARKPQQTARRNST